MKHFFPTVPALLAILFGSILLLNLLGWSTLQDPHLGGIGYYQAVLGKLFGPRTTWTTLFGVGFIVLGLASILHAVFLAGSDMQEGRQALPVFWVALGVGILGMVVLLVAVNYLGMQAGEIRSLSECFRR